MITCKEFEDNGIKGDPVIPDPIPYNTDIGADPGDTRVRRQAPYPKNGGNSYGYNYHQLALDYVLVKDTLISSTGIYAPTDISNVIMSLDRSNLDYNLISYNNSWNYTLPFPLSNPPIIDSTSFSQGIVDYWLSMSINQQNCTEGTNLTASYTTNATDVRDAIKSDMDNFIDPDTQLSGISCLYHEELCTILKNNIINLVYTITESCDDDATSETTDESGSITYTVKLQES